jgi:integrase
MATIVNDPNGRKRIQFVDADGSRRTIRLGKCDKRTAESVCRHVEALLAAKLAGQPLPRETAVWLSGIGDKLRERLEKVGLAESRPRATLGGFLRDFLTTRQPLVKPGTLMNINVAANKLREHFSDGCNLADIGPAEAEAFAAWLHQTQAPATAGRLIRRTRQFFRVAVRQKLIAENPFDGIKATGQPDKARQVYVSRETIEQVIAACPDAEWRLLLALSRYAGLRCPSEHLALTWNDVNWEKGTFRIDSPKTGERWVPIFPELRPYLEAVWEQALPGSVYVINRYRSSNVNLRTQLVRIIRRAGLTPWPKLFHNLRVSCQVDLTESYPIHRVCYWLGNSTAIASKHYLSV